MQTSTSCTHTHTHFSHTSIYRDILSIQCCEIKKGGLKSKTLLAEGYESEVSVDGKKSDKMENLVAKISLLSDG